MTRRILTLLAPLIVSFSAAAAEPALQLPPFERVVLSNGLSVLLSEAHEVPLVSCQILVRAGGAADPAGKEGAASLTAELLQRGTRARTAAQIAEQLDFIGATFTTQATRDHTMFAAEFMKKDLPGGLALLAEMFMEPAFPAEEVTKLRDQRIDAVKQAKDEVREVLPRYFYAALYRDHPYGRWPEGDETSLAGLTREDVVAFHQRYYGPSNTILAVVGDFASAELRETLTKQFGGWRGGAATAPRPPAPTPLKGRRLVLVNKPDATQTFFMIGNVGVPRTHADRTGLLVVNTLFGGRFTSMLNEALRINSGLTYGASSRFAAHAAAGPFWISSFTENKTTTNALTMTLGLLDQLHREGLVAAQLRSGKTYLKGQYPPQVEATDDLAALLTDLEFHGLGAEEVNQLFARIDAVSLADTRRLVREHFPRENLLFVLVGRAEEIRTAVAPYVTEMELLDIRKPGYR